MQETLMRSRAQIFLRMYRVLEGILEKRYEDVKKTPSVVVRYLSEADSEPIRAELDTCREIRNILSHSADEEGNPLIEPSEAVLEQLAKILEYVQRPHLAMDLGTPADKLLSARMNDRIQDLMRHMSRKGFSHAPVLEHGQLIGVFSPMALFDWLERHGIAALTGDARVSWMRDVLNRDRNGAEKYRFLPKDATVYQARAAFEEEMGRNNRLSAVFITENGTGEEPILAMLTHWDVLKDPEETNREAHSN